MKKISIKKTTNTKKGTDPSWKDRLFRYKGGIKQQGLPTLGGSITIEAAFIIPLVVFLMFSLIYLSFYLHDLCKIQDIINQVSHRAALMVKHDTDIASGEIAYEEINQRGVFYFLLGHTEDDEAQIRDYLRSKLSKGLFIVKIKQVEIKLTKRKLVVEIDASPSVSIKGFPEFFSFLRDRTLKQEYRIHNPAETLRKAEVILDTGSKLKGIDALKEKLDSFLHRE